MSLMNGLTNIKRNNMKSIFLKYYPFCLGLLVCIILIGKSSQYGFWSFSVLLAYIIGYFKLTNFEQFKKK
jgi:hypothetical protein